MRLALPFSHQVEYRLRYQRLPRTATVLSTVHIEIDEAETPSAPAFILGHAERALYLRPDAWTRFRVWNGKPVRVWRLPAGLYAEYCPVDRLLHLIENGDHTPFEAERDGVSSSPFDDRADELSSYEEVSTKGLVRSWKSVDESERYETIAARASAMRVVDGMICAPVGEPVVVVDDDEGEILVRFLEGVSPGQCGFKVQTESWDGRRYNIDQFSEAVGYAKRLASARGRHLSVRAWISCANQPSLRIAQEGEHLNRRAKELARLLEETSGALRKRLSEALLVLEQSIANCPDLHATIELALSMEVVLTALQDALRSVQVAGDSVANELVAIVPEVQADIEAWKHRRPYSGDWAARALPCAANRSYQVEQLLSEAALLKAIRECGLNEDVAVSQVALGDLLLFAGTTQSGVPPYRIVSVSPNLETVRNRSSCPIGLGGRLPGDRLDR